MRTLTIWHFARRQLAWSELFLILLFTSRFGARMIFLTENGQQWWQLCCHYYGQLLITDVCYDVTNIVTSSLLHWWSLSRLVVQIRLLANDGNKVERGHSGSNSYQGNHLWCPSSAVDRPLAVFDITELWLSLKAENEVVNEKVENLTPVRESNFKHSS